MQLDLRKESQHYVEKLKKIKVALFDVDGILTDSGVYWAGSEVGFNRHFHVRDGYMMREIQKYGIKVGIISGGDSRGVVERFNLIGLAYMFLGNEDKRGAFNEILQKENINEEEVLYMGDEFFDLPLLKRAGFAATVPSASHEIRDEADYITYRDSGQGCVREVLDMLRYAQNIEIQVDY